MKNILASRLNKKPFKKVFFAIVLYILVCVASLSGAMGVCYAYFASKVEASGSAEIGALSVNYYNDSALADSLNAYLTRSSSTETHVEVSESTPILPGDVLHFQGKVKNDGSIPSYVLIEVSVTLTYNDGSSDQTKTDKKFYTTSGKAVTLASDGIYHESDYEDFTALQPESEANIDIQYTFETTIDNQYAEKSITIDFTIRSYQAEGLVASEDYESLDMQVLHEMTKE